MGRIGTKKDLRRYLLFSRRLLGASIYEERNRLLAARATDLVRQESKKCLHIFLPITRNREPDTFLLIRRLVDLKLIVSKTDFEHHRMDHFVYDDTLELEENEFNIPEPVSGLRADTDEIDLVFVPLLGVDRSGNRIGYGKGYYDQLLAEMKPDVLKVGLSLGPVLDHIPYTESHDMTLDYCITPFQTISFS